MNQDYDFLEILSLKFSQKEAYTSLCSDYGVVCGRVTANDGLGIPNVKVAIFIPISEIDKLDPVVSAIYPYEVISSQDVDNIRFNVLPARKQHSGHTPTGTFPDQSDLLQQEELVYVFETYYKYTAKTNDAGDFMIWGVPVGQHTIHFDVDLSDIGCQSLVPYDLMYEGVSEEKFENKYTYLSSTNLDTLPQIITIDKTINVYPFWGNQDLCEIGITRVDFDLKERGVRIDPYALIMGGTVSDGVDDMMSYNCDVGERQGEKCRLVTKKGDIEAIRFTGKYETDDKGKPNPKRPILEMFKIDSTIDEHGRFFFRVPMNMKYIKTDEFGEIVESKDPNVGIATSGTYRFRLTLTDESGGANKGINGTFLVPNIREYHINDPLFKGEPSTIDTKSYAFSPRLDDYPTAAIDEIVGLSKTAIDDNKIGIPQDYFYQFRYSRVYTVSQFINRYMSANAYTSGGWFWSRTTRNKEYFAFKDIYPDKETDCSNTHVHLPVNDATKKNRANLFLITTLNWVNYGNLAYQLAIREFNVMINWLFGGFFGGSNAAASRRRNKEYQFKNIMKLKLTVYPDCYDCEEDAQANSIDYSISTINIADYTGTTSLNGATFYMAEKYYAARSVGTCSQFTINNSNGTSQTVLYIDCNNNTQTLTIGASENGRIICAKSVQPLPSGVTKTEDNSNTNACLSYDPNGDLYFRNETNGAYAQYTLTNLPTSATSSLYDGKLLKQQYVIGVNVLGAGLQYYTIGIGQQFPIVYDATTSYWKIQGLYTNIATQIGNAYNQPMDGVVSGSAHNKANIVDIQKIWLVTYNYTGSTTGAEEETGCQKYDTIYDNYNEAGGLVKQGSMRLKSIKFPITLKNGTTLGTYVDALNYIEEKPPDNYTGNAATGWTTSNNQLLWNDLDNNYYSEIYGLGEDECAPRPQYNYGAVASVYAKWPGNGSGSFINDDVRCVRFGKYAGTEGKGKSGSKENVDPLATTGGTLSGYSEFRDGVYTIIPMAGRTFEMLADFRRRKTFASFMCSGIVNYTFSNSWLNGMLYFFKFAKNNEDFCKDNMFKKVGETDNKTYYYYRSTPYSPSYSGKTNTTYTQVISSGTTSHLELQYDYSPENGTRSTNPNTGLTQTYLSQTNGFYGHQRLLDFTGSYGGLYYMFSPYAMFIKLTMLALNNNDSSLIRLRREINFPTTIVDLGPRQTWIKEVCTDPSLDVNCAITRSIGNTSFKNITDLMEYVIGSKEIKERGRLTIDSLFANRGFNLIDGDVAQLLNFNTQTGIYPFEYSTGSISPYGHLYDNLFDGRGAVSVDFVYSVDDPDTKTIEANGREIRLCINQPGRLGDNSQRVPYFKWDTVGDGFGDSKSTLFGITPTDTKTSEMQNYFTSYVYNQRLQEFKANLNGDLNNNVLDNNFIGNDSTNSAAPWLLPPIRDCIEINGVKKKSYDNYKEYTVGGKGRHLMEIGVPFHYCFGIKKGSTAYDKFLESYGPQ